MRRKVKFDSTTQYRAGLPTRLRAIMEEQKTTQQEVAELVGVTRQSVGNYMSGTCSPDWGTIVKLAQFFGVSVDWLLGVSDFRANETAEIPVKTVGLSDQATKRLITLSQLGDPLSRHKISVINTLLEYDGIEFEREERARLLENMALYFYPVSIPNQRIVISERGAEIVNQGEEINHRPGEHIAVLETDTYYHDKILTEIDTALHYIGQIQSWIEAEYAPEEWEEIRKERENDGKYQDGD